MAPAIEKWNTETKYQLHDHAAEAVAKVTDAAKEKIDVAKETLDTAKELAKGGVEVAKATTQVAVENAKLRQLKLLKLQKIPLSKLLKQLKKQQNPQLTVSVIIGRIVMNPLKIIKYGKILVNHAF